MRSAKPQVAKRIFERAAEPDLIGRESNGDLPAERVRINAHQLGRLVARDPRIIDRHPDVAIAGDDILTFFEIV